MHIRGNTFKKNRWRYYRIYSPKHRGLVLLFRRRRRQLHMQQHVVVAVLVEPRHSLERVTLVEVVDKRNPLVGRF